MPKKHPTSTGRTQAIHIRRGLCLYKQPQDRGGGSPYWYARAAVEVGGRKVHTKSTGTTDVRAAEKAAEELWGDLQIVKRFGVRALPNRSINIRPVLQRFDRVADQWLRSLEAAAETNERKLRRWQDHRKIVAAKNGLKAFFGRRDIAAITTGDIEDYLGFAAERSEQGSLRPSTQRNLLATLRLVLSFAVNRGLMPSAPELPRVRQKDNPRAWFRPEEYRALNIGAYILQRHARKCGDKLAAARWLELQDFVPFMVNSFLRPSEWGRLRHKHVEVVDGPNPHLRIALIDGKVRPRTVYTMPGAVRAYERIVRRRGSNPEDYVFLPHYRNRETGLQVMRAGFKELMAETGTELDPFGRKRVIYSLRHSALMLRVLNGDNVDLLALARNAGTSIDMLQRFYCSHLDAGMKIANLQSFRG
jgi:hypothetical protein